MRFCKVLFENLKGYVEIRTIKNKIVRSQNFFKDYKEIFKRNWPEDRNIYVGVFTRSYKKGTSKSAHKTKVLWADYDNFSLNDIKYNLSMENIPDPSMIINSGHGYHCYWLLDTPAGKEAIPVVKAIANKTGADTGATDPARVMRVPGTMNVKSDPVKCEMLENNNKKYSLQDIAARVGINDLTKPQNRGIEKFRGYEGLDIDKIKRPCMKSILQGVEEGQRNWALGRLTKYLKVKGFSKSKSLDLLLEWNKRNDPPENVNKLKYDFKAYRKGDYELLGCKMKKAEHQQNLNEHCNRSKCKFSSPDTETKLDNVVEINNRVFNRYKTITGNDLIIYGILLREEQGLNTTQIKKAILNHKDKKPCMSRPTIYKSIDHLKSMGLIKVRERPGRPKFCKHKAQGTYGMGYTLLSNGAINGAIDGRVTPAQLKVYVLLSKYDYNGGAVFPGVITLADKIGIDHSTISNHLFELEKRSYIKREYEYNNKGVEKLIIRLLV